MSKFLLLFLSILIGSFGILPSKALACSYAPEIFSGMDNYYAYSTWTRDVLQEEDYFATVVKTKNRGSKSAKNSTFYSFLSENSPDKLWKLKLKIELEIIGQAPKKVYAPVMTEAEEILEKNYLSTEKNVFDFWDGFQLTAAKSTWYGDWTSCGLTGDNIFLNNQSYLIIGRNEKIFYAEPVNGVDDPIVLGIAAFINRDDNNPLNMLPKRFFNQMNGYQVFEIKECPNSYAIEKNSYDDYLSMFENLEEENLLQPIKTQNFLFTEQCQIGDRYLLIERKLETYTRAGQYRVGDMKDPAHRFVKIENGMIVLDDIPTNYEFVGSESVPVDQVKTWIKESRINK